MKNPCSNCWWVKRGNEPMKNSCALCPNWPDYLKYRDSKMTPNHGGGRMGPVTKEDKRICEAAETKRQMSYRLIIGEYDIQVKVAELNRVLDRIDELEAEVGEARAKAFEEAIRIQCVWCGQGNSPRKNRHGMFVHEKGDDSRICQAQDFRDLLARKAREATNGEEKR